MELLSNVVNTKHLSDLYLDILTDLSNILSKSYGPYGSNSLIQKGKDSFPIYTKDGKTILENVKYHNIIERTITSNILSITEHIVKHVGDGTTSAVLLSKYILENLINLQNKARDTGELLAPVEIVRSFQNIVKNMIKHIHKNGRDLNINKDAYYISMISTNGDNDISMQIHNLYKELGKDVYIALTITSQKEDIVSIYEGLVLESGLIEEAYINDPEKKVSRIYNPHIYAFTDPVDTPEMIKFFETIVMHNIYDNLSWQPRGEESDDDCPPIVPTVIITPKMSRDASVLMEHITQTMGKMAGGMIRKRPPILVITNLESVDQDQYADIIQMCGCKPIKKYINPEIQKKDQESGSAPTFDNVWEFYGTCDVVEADNYRTSFISPSNMVKNITDAEGNVTVHKTQEYLSLINFLETELDKAKEAKKDYTEIYHLKKRLNSLKATFVEWHVGGISPADRDQRMSVIDDAVKNCRSAARDGVGFGANYEGFSAIKSIENDFLATHNLNGYNLDYEVIEAIKDAYLKVIYELYKYTYSDFDHFRDAIYAEYKLGPRNLNKNTKTYPVLSSINSDIMILEGMANLITIMATSNQYICPEPIDTAPYRADENIRKKKEKYGEENAEY